MKIDELTRIKELAGVPDSMIAPTTGAQPNTDVPPKKAYSIVAYHVMGKDDWGRNAWDALQELFPKDYPTLLSAQKKIAEVATNGKAIIKSGIASIDIAETLAEKLEQRGVPTQVV